MNELDKLIVNKNQFVRGKINEKEYEECKNSIINKWLDESSHHGK
jgi:hypothetical protein